MLWKAEEPLMGLRKAWQKLSETLESSMAPCWLQQSLSKAVAHWNEAEPCLDIGKAW